MLNQARAFLEAVLPWDAPQPAYCNIHWRSQSTQDGKSKTFWGGRAFTDIDTMVGTLNWALRQPDIADLYVCMSAQSMAEPRESRNGNRYINAVRSQANAVALRSLYADLDVKEGAYADTNEALAALRAFLADTGLPRPTAVVGSGGGGFHVHWVTDRALSPAEWQPLANALSGALRQHGVHCDLQCTIDSARILRIPDTLNRKYGEPRPVQLMGLGKKVPVEELQAVLGKYMQAPALPQLAPRLTPAGNSNDELGAGIAVGTRLADIEQVRKTCAFVDNALTTGGAALHNPLWLMTTSIASFCEDGRTQAHRMADQHRTYTAEETDRLYDRVLATRTRRDFGWPKCSRIDALGAKECQTCPLRPLDKSPLNHPPAPAGQGSAPSGAGAAPASDLPAGYTRDAQGRVCRIVLDESGVSQPIPVCAYPMTDAWLQDNPWVLHFSTIIHSGRVQKIEAPLAEMSARDGIGKIMGRQGIVLPEKGAQALREFFVAWIQRLQQSKNSVVSSTPFGWTVANGKLEGFTYAGRVWGDGEDRPAASPDPILSYQYSPKGELNPWLEAARIITDQKRPHLDAILAASFGGPLVRFTGQAGVMLSCYSPESGIGKSTAMRVAQAIWGDPQKALQSLNDTANSVIRKIGEIKNLPLLWDEIKTESETSKFVLMSFQLTQGKERSRLNADVTQRDPGTWQTLLISASNDSLIDPIQRVTKSTNAGLYRLFEYQVPPGVHGQVEHSMVSRAIAKLNDHYGQAGLAYARFLGANSDRIAREVAEIQDELSREVSAGNDERFWIATMTVVLAGARYANELGLTEIDEAALKNLMVIVLGNMRSEIKDAPTDMKNQLSVSTILAQFLNAMRARHTLRTNKIHVGRGKPPKNSVQIRSDVTKLDAIYVQIGEDDGLMRISSTHFSQWMSDRDYSRHAFVKALEQEFGVKTTHGRLGSGTQFANTTEYLLELDLNDPRLKGFVE